MEQAALPNWESQMIDEAIREAEERREQERNEAAKRAVQLAREQAYHRLALEIDRPQRNQVSPSQLSFFPADPTLFDEE